MYALGDCASVEGQELPSTAQATERQGRYLAKALGELAKSGQPEVFVFKPWGMLAYVGGYKALMDTSLSKLQVGKHAVNIYSVLNKIPKKESVS